MCYKWRMVWIILFLPICIWMGIGIISTMNLLSIAGVAITMIVFAILEFRWVCRDKDRSRTPLWIMLMIIGSVILGLVWK